MNKLNKAIQFIANPHLLLCFGLAWCITNGWAYAFLGLGAWLGIPWMAAVASSYMVFLWLPLTPEKIVTVAIALFLLKRLFPNDQKTLRILRNLAEKFKRKKNKPQKENHF